MTIEAIVAPRKTSSETRRVAEAACVTASARMVMSKAQYNRETGNARVLNPFDAVLVVAFGGPQGPADIRPFLENVLRGRRVAPGRLEEVAHHYELFGGVSPITALTLKQADGLRSRLIGAGAPLPVYVGMRNWHPFLVDTLAAMAQGRRASRDWFHRGRASELLELHAVSRKRRRRPGARWPRRGCRTSRSPSRQTGTRIRGSLPPTSTISRRRAVSCRRRFAIARRSCSRRTASRCRWPNAIRISSRSRRASER